MVQDPLTLVQNPTKTLKLSAPLALLGTTILYILVNIAYFAASTKAQILSSKLTTASLFFENVFGNSGASKALSFLIAVSAFGNLIAVLIGQSRVIRECGRLVLTSINYLCIDSLTQPQTRCPPFHQLLDFHKTLRNTSRPILPKVVPHSSHDPSSSSRRCFQLW